MVIQSLLYEMKGEFSYQPVILNFSAQTNSKQIQQSIEGKLIKKAKTLFGARVNETIAIFIDDVNMPALEQFGAQPSIELLRQILELQGVFDRNKLFWKNIEDISVICAGGPPGGGRNKLSQRFLRQFNILNMPLQSDTILEKIYGQILKGYLHSINFPESVRRMNETITKITIELFRKISSELLPIPAKFHYTFNSRDISKVFQGLLMVKPISVNSPDQMLKLWLHECARVFCDRLISLEDRLWFYQIAGEFILRNFSINKDEISNAIIFSDVLKLEAANVLYEDVSDKRKVITNALSDKLIDYALQTNDKMELVFFEDALEHILRIARIFRQPRGNAMLIGVGGSGKQSLTKLAAFLMRSEIFQLEIAKGYNQDSFRADLQKILMRTGVDRTTLTFIFTEAQIVFESFLEDINNILNTGEVPNLFAKKEELEAVYQGIRNAAIKAKRPDSPESLWNFFVEGIRNNLHIVLCMSPVGNQLRIRSRKFPSLINCCTLDWFSQWPKEALLEVANTFLDKLEGVNVKDKLAEMCMEVAVSVQDLCVKFQRELRRQVYTTPKSYLDQIKLYSTLLQMKQQEYGARKIKLAEGLDKLFKANETVAILKVEMQEMQPQLVEQQTKTEQFLAQLSIDQSEANLKERLVNDEAQIVNQQAFEIKLIADEAQAELSKALPALKEAEDALLRINKNDIAEIKGFINPPPIVVMVLEGVCILLNEKTDWSSAKQVMLGNDFMERLVKYDKNLITDQTLKKLRLITNKPEFEPIFVGQKSAACKSLCMWCRAIDSYSKIAKEVEPKKKRVSDMQQKLEVKNKELQFKQDELQKVRDRVAKLQKECDETVEKKNHLERELEKTKKRLVAAEKLTYLLADEGIRWKEQIKGLGNTLEQCVGDVFLSATTISYLGAFTGQYRDIVVKSTLQKMRTLNIPCSDNYSLSNTLESPIVIRDWIVQGLPNDLISVDNGVIVKRCDRWPLLIDPQGQGNKWLKQHYKEIKVMRFSEGHYLKMLSQCVSSGFEALFEEVDSMLEPAIDSVLQKQVVEIDGRRLIKVGDQKVDYNPQFKMYLTCKMANPDLLPEVFIKTTVINFSITFAGLQDQLLGDVMLYEKPEIEKQRDEVVIKMSNATKSLKQAQDQILDLLANAQGMILDNDQLINTLELSKLQSIDIEKSLVETQILEQQINESRNLYFSVATRGTILYFVIQDMSLIDPMYQFSLQYFKKLFQMSMSLTAASEVLQERLDLLESTITRTVFKDICRGLFQQHKRIFSFLICSSIQKQSKNISQQGWNLLLRDSLPNQPTPNPDKVFLKDQSWNMILCMQEQLPELSDFSQDIKNNMLFWKDYSVQENLYSAPFPVQSPLSASNTFNSFNKLLIIKALKPEKLMNAFMHYVKDQFGSFYVDILQSSMEEVFEASDSYTPIIFILSSGADPTQMLFKLAKEQQMLLEVISLGQGQGQKAEIMINKAQKEGQWVMLQNCHLARSWMSQLEKLMEHLTTRQIEVHQNFRIFLTSMPVPYFPVSTLQNGLKLTTEPPRGIRANLLRSFQEFQFPEEQISRPNLFKQLFFSISFFHAIAQERRKFGPLGFNIGYEFNDSDLDISVQMMRMFINTEEEIPWDAMSFMIGQINYGGRVTDDQDRICLTAILKKYLGDHIEERARFSQSGIYYIPIDGEIQNYIQYVETLPTQEDPEVFGMHENANIVFQAQESQKVLETILYIQPRISSDSDEGVKSPDQIVMDKAIYFQDQLPEILEKISCNPKHFQLADNGSIQSLSTVLLQEIDKFNRLLELMQSSLQQLQLAIKGFVLISQELDEMYIAFLNNQIPPNWSKKSYSTLKPLASWFKDLIARVGFLKLWMEKDYIPAYWMSGLFYPQGFLTGVLQTHSRKYKIPINKLNFKFKVLDLELDRVREEPKDGVYVYGLYLEGARWDYQHETLSEQQLGQIYYPLTMMYFLPMEEYQPPDDYYSCPCYKTSNRTGVLSTTGQSTNFVLSIDLQSKTEKPEQWTLRGTAILSQLND